MRLNVYVDATSLIISRSLLVIGRISKFVPCHVLKSLYYSMIHPYMTYSLQVWYEAPKYFQNEIKMLQKRAVRNIYGLGYREHTEPYFKEMKLLRISDYYRYLIGVIICSISHEYFTIIFLNSVVTYWDQHYHRNRNRELYVSPVYKKTHQNNLSDTQELNYGIICQ